MFLSQMEYAQTPMLVVRMVIWSANLEVVITAAAATEMQELVTLFWQVKHIPKMVFAFPEALVTQLMYVSTQDFTMEPCHLVPMVMGVIRM
jgi:hypothetical protein